MPSHAPGDRAARRLLADAQRAERRRLATPIGLGFAAILCAIAQALLVARLLAALLGHGEAGWPDLALAALLVLLTAGLVVAQERAQQRAGEAARARLRLAAFSRLLALGPADQRAIGEKATLVVDRIEALDGYFARWIPAGALALLGPAAVVLAAAAADPTSGLILGVAGLLVPLALALTGIGAAAASRSQFGALQRLSGRFLDRMRGLSTLVLFRRQEAEAAALGAAAEELRTRTMRVLRVAFLTGGALEAIAAGALACLAWRHGAALLGAGHPDPVAALFCILLVPVFFQPLRSFAIAYHDRMTADGAAAELAPLLAQPAPGGLLLAEVPPAVTVTFQDVRLSYDASRGAALAGLSFRALAGETVVLSGASGAGKTSVLRLLMGFARPDAGRIAINGQDATALAPAELRRLSSYVGQRAHLFAGTIAENIAYARPGASEADIRRAAEAARVTAFADTLPEGLATRIGEGGYGLSGGQAQRVAIARAFLRDTPLVLLDEPTAHLDPGTEAEVLDALRRLCIGRTAIIASHSRAARRHLGRVVELDAGRVVDGQRMAGE
jgi:ATP-binding cassette subfamily C protein CydD